MYGHQELLDLLNKQKFLYDKDMTHWKVTLESSTKLLKQVCTLFNDLYFILDVFCM